MTFLSYDELPYLAKQSLKTYPYLEETDYPLVKFTLETIAIEEAKNRCMSFDELSDMYSSFDEFHKNYVSFGDVPEHNEMYPVFENVDSDYEWLEDGWHRFNSYVRSGFKTIDVMRVYGIDY